MSTEQTNIVYDAAIILGSKPNEQTKRFPSHIYAALDAAAELYRAGKARYLVLSGNYALRYDRDGQKAPFRECDAMATYLTEHHHIPTDALLLEGTSKDTVANFYYTKRDVLMPHSLTRLVLIAAEFRIERLTFLAAKIFGPAYTTDFQPVTAHDDEVNPTESVVMQRTRDFLAPMQDGEHSFLDDAFYTHAFYQRPR